jgi:Haemolysin-type calcium binding protein related domain
MSVNSISDVVSDFALHFSKDVSGNQNSVPDASATAAGIALGFIAAGLTDGVVTSSSIPAIENAFVNCLSGDFSAAAEGFSGEALLNAAGAAAAGTLLAIFLPEEIGIGLAVLGGAAVSELAGAALEAMSQTYTDIQGGIGINGLLADIGNDVLSNPIGAAYALTTGDLFGFSSVDPLVIDLSGAGLNLTSLSTSSPYFNWGAGQISVQTGWIGTGAGFLVLENSSGQIGSSNLFGPGASSGFAALQALDSNGDGVINSSDADFSKLAVWEDTNGDGVAESGEVFTLAQLGIQSISLTETVVNEQIGGNVVEDTAIATLTDGSTREIAEVEFAIDAEFSRNAGAETVSDAAAALPQLQGYGNLIDLRGAMSQDAALLTDVQSLMAVSPTDMSSFGLGVQQVMFEWAGMSGVNPTSRGSVFDAQKLGFLEQFLGTNYTAADGSNPTDFFQAIPLSNAYEAVLDGIAARLLVQDPNSPLAGAFVVNAATDKIELASNLGATLTQIENNVPSDATAVDGYWAGALLVINQLAADSAFPSATTSLLNIALELAVPSDFSSDVVSAAASGTLTYIDASPLTETIANGANVVYGTSGVDLFQVAAPNMTLVGGGGGDEFLVGSGMGSLTIVETDEGAIPDNVLQFDSSVSEANVSVSRGSGQDIVLTLDTSGDSVTLYSMAFNSSVGVQSVRFADGTVWDRLQILARAGMTTNSFSLSVGDGQSEVDLAGDAPGSQSLQLGAGIAPDDVLLQADAAGDLTVTLKDGGDSVTFENDLNAGGGFVSSILSQISYADGETTNIADSVGQAVAVTSTWVGTATKTTLIGTDWGPNIFEMGAGGDTVVGGPGANEFEFDKGDGQAGVTLNSASNILVFAPDVAEADVAVTTNAEGDLVIGFLDTTDGITFKNALSDTPDGELSAVSFQFADGTAWSGLQVGAMSGVVNLVSGSSGGPTTLTGTANADTFDSGGFARVENGEGGSDTFIFNQGYGSLEISQYDPSSTANNILKFGPGISLSDLTVTADRLGNVYIRDGVGGDEVTLDNEMEAPYGVETVEFADGTVLSRTQLLALEEAGTTGADFIYGSSAGEVFDGKGGGDTINGGGGGDTFIYNPGYGNLTISELDTSGNPDNILKFGAGISLSDLTVTADSNGDFFIKDGVSGDEIELVAQIASSQWGVQGVEFADGTVLNEVQLIDLEEAGTPGPDVIYGTNLAETFDTKGGDDYVYGGGGGDTFVYKQGYGILEINEGDSSSSPNNVLQFGAGISLSDLTLRGDANGDILIKIGTVGSLDGFANGINVPDEPQPGDFISLIGELDGAADGVQTLTFADGTSLSKQQLINLEETTTTGADVIYGTPGAETFDGQGGGDYIEGGGGGDTFIFNQGYGLLEIAEVDNSATPNNILRLGPGILEGDVTVTQGSNGIDNPGLGSIVLTIGSSGDKIILDSAYANPGDGVQAVYFADGGIWTRQYLLALINGTASTGTAGLALSRGDGHLVVNMEGVAAGQTLQMGAGISASDVLVQADNAGDLSIVLADTGDSITFQNDLTQFSWGGIGGAVSQINFADGSHLVVGRQPTGGGDNMTFTWDASATNTNLVGSEYAVNVFNLAPGSDTVTAGSDALGAFINTFNFDKGDGHATVNMAGAIGALQLASDISASDVLVQADNAGDLTVVLADTGDSITFQNDFTQYSWGGVGSAMSQINFGNGAPSLAIGRQATGGGQDMTFTWDASATNTNLVGSKYGSNVFNLAAGGDTVTAGSDALAAFTNTFKFDKGDGNVTVNMAGATGALQMAFDVAASDVLVQADNAGDLTIVLADTGDSITFENDLSVYSTNNGLVASALSQINFANGATSVLLGRANGGPNLTFTWDGSATDTALVGSNYGNNVFNLAPGSDTVTAGDASINSNFVNTFNFDKGDGHATVNMNGGAGVLNLASDIAASDVLVQADNAGDLTVVLADTGDSITFENDLSDYYVPAGLVSSEMSQINFGNGASSILLGRAGGGPNLTFTWDGTSTDTTLVGSKFGSNVFNLAPGSDTITAGDTSINSTFVNTFNFDKGDGHATVNMNGGAGVLNLASDIAASDVLVQADNAGDLTVVLADTGDSITFENDITTYSWGGVGSAMSQINFDNGSSSLAIGRQPTGGGQNLAFTWDGSATNNALVGSNYGPNTFNIGAGSESITGGNGNNSFEFGASSGQAAITVTSGGTNELDFGSGINDEDLWFAQSGNDLQIDLLGTSDSVTVKNWYSSSSNQLQEITAGGLKLDSQVSQLVSAMATFEASNSSFNPITATLMPTDSALQGGIAAAWHT